MLPFKEAGINSEDVKTFEEYSAQVQQTRNFLNGLLAQKVDTSEDENVQAPSKHYDTALPKNQDPKLSRLRCSSEER